MGMVWRGTGFSLKGETGGIHLMVILLFVVLTMVSVLRKLFSGDLDFRKTETNLFWREFGLGSRAEEGSGEESARASFDFFSVGDFIFCRSKNN